MCSGKMISKVLKTIMFMIVFSAVTSLFLILDGYLKTLYARKYPEAGRRLMLSLVK